MVEMLKNQSKRDLIQQKVQLKIPKILLQEIDLILQFSDLNREALFTQLILDRLENLYSNPEELLFYIKSSSLLENLRRGINQYYSKEIHKNCHKNEPNLNSDYEHEIVELELRLPKSLYRFFEKFHELTGWELEMLINRFIRNSLELIYNSPEMIIEILKRSSLLEIIKEGIDAYYRVNKKLEDNIQSG